MKRVVLALSAVGATVAVAIPLTTAGAQAPGGRTINLVERERGGTFRFVDNPPKVKRPRRPVLSVGDMAVFSIPLFDEANTTPMGRLHVQCLVTMPGRQNRSSQLCTGVFKLNDGQISIITALKGDPDVVTGIVTGGDGAYVGARGTFSSGNQARGINRDVITLLP